MILAAGRGERMRELTAELPKPLLRVAGEALIERHLRRLTAAGIGEVVINLSYRGAQIVAALGGGERYGLEIRYSEEGEPPLETGGGIVQALPLLGSGLFVLLNADILTDFDFAVLSHARRPTLVLVPNPAHHPDGDFGIDAGGRVTPRPPLYTFAGLSVLHTDMFAALEPGRSPLKPVLDAAIERRDLYGLVYTGAWLDVGTPERFEQAPTLSASWHR
jgi:MurNAc alpha-1-phosphate uridylyltransferase